MMYALAVLLLIAINVHGQKEVCTLAPELVDVYQGFHDRWFKRPGRTYVTVTFKPDMYPLAKEVLNEPGRYATDNEVYKVTKGWMILTEDSSTIEKKVEKVLRSKFIFQLVKLKFSHPRKFACAGKFDYVSVNRQNLSILCIYARDSSYN